MVFIMSSKGKIFKQLVEQSNPLQVVGTINAYSAMLAHSVGFKSIYLSGAGVANANYGIPDLGMTNLSEVCEEIRRISGACDLPLLVDADTGWGHAYNIARCVKQVERSGACGLHIEDQVLAKRCGHRPNKAIVSVDEMRDRVKAAVDARIDNDFVIMARTDAFAAEGMSAVIERAEACIEAGADMLFPEAMITLKDYEYFSKNVSVPVLANITEFGKTPLFTTKQLNQADVKLVLYPLSAFRAMSKAALSVYQSILSNGSQEEVIDMMQTREELYEQLNYHQFEKQLDNLWEKENVE
jgi:methylisocitrate lyase